MSIMHRQCFGSEHQNRQSINPRLFNWPLANLLLRLDRNTTLARAFFLTLFTFLSLFPGSKALADIAFVKTIGTAASTSTGTTLSVTVPASGVAAGTSVIVSIAINPSTGTVSCTDTRSNSYAVDSDI